ncbi:hypothetical protein GGI15_003271 [Coemansia interrupta]|uniref:SCP domain-containing protein n=1 Tax=Coemansia interrupta TaxID=1126814 RepID=A0A9W8LID5_9FUNG|nr:hypothetical protein GGI15_003271 [Coemansia interrupta]
MVQLSATLVFAASMVASLVGALPLGDTLARRHEAITNPNYHTYTQPKTVTVTVTKYLNGYPQSSTPQYSSEEPASSPSYTDNSSSSWQNQMLQQVNAIRASVGKPALTLDSRMNTMAQDHSNYQASISQMTHSDSAGGLGDRCSDVGVSWRGVAENVAWNYKDVTAVVEGWKNSPGHYANMIGDYTICGFGQTDLYWTQDFASV